MATVWSTLAGIAAARWLRNRPAGVAVGATVGSHWVLGLVTFTGVIWVSGPWSPPPPSAETIAVVALALWLLPLRATWIERHRTERAPGVR
jgi:hypothetical protein